MASDALGSKPLFVAADPAGRYLLFASELKALYAHGAVKPDVDPEALATFLIAGCLTAPFAIQPGVTKLLPSELLTFGVAGAFDRRHYSQQRHQFQREASTFDGWAALLREEVTAAVNRSARSSTPVAVLQSGGTDSNVVMASLRLAGIEPRAFSLNYTGSDSDTNWAAQMASEIGVARQEIAIRPEDADPETLVRLLSLHDEPVDGSRALTQYYLCRSIQEAGLNSALGGDSSESLFGWSKGWTTFSEGIRTGQDSDALIQKNQENARFFQFGELRRLLIHPPEPLEALPGRCAIAYRPCFDEGSPYDLITGLAFLSWPFTRPGVNMHGISRHAGIDVRPAFRDRRLLEFSRTIPVEFRCAGDDGIDRALLIAAFAAQCPSLSEPRPKSAFPALPLRDPAFSKIQASVLRGVQGLKRFEMFNPRTIDRQVEKFQRNNSPKATAATVRIWLLFGLYVWLEKHIGNQDPLSSLV